MPATEKGTNYFPFRPDQWSAQVNRFFYNKLVLAPFFWNVSDDVTGGGKTVVIPSTTETFSALSVSTTTGEVTSTILSDTVIRLDIDKWYSSSRVISDYMAAQVDSKYGGFDMYQQDLAYALAKQLDMDLIDAAGDVGNTNFAFGTSTSSMSATSLESGIALMESYSIPRDGLMFVFHPQAYWNGPMKRQKLYDASQFGKASLPLGIHDMLYGVPVVLTQQVHKDGTRAQSTGSAGQRASGYNNLLVHTKKVVYALGNLEGPASAGIRIKVGTPTEHLRTKIIADIMYGVKSANKNYAYQH